MRSRTSRGVPEWSGGKDLYMGRLHSDTGMVRVVSDEFRSIGPSGGIKEAGEGVARAP